MSGAREQFGSRIGFILAAAGSAVGIGNLVGFPVGAAKNGGGAFLLMYAIFVFAICLPVMLAEMSVGRHAKKDPLGAYSDISGNEKKWKVAGWLAIATPFMIAVFYMVITVWLFGYLFEAVSGNLDKLANPETFGLFINSEAIFLYMAAVVGVVYLILQGGVKEGIEKAAKLLMPALFVMLIGLATKNPEEAPAIEPPDRAPPDSIATAGSPGTTRRITNTTVNTSNIVGMKSMRRLIK